MIAAQPSLDIAPGRVLFAEDFDLPEGYAHVLVPDEPEPEVITPSYSVEELEEARQDGLRAGERAGWDLAAAERETHVAQALTAIARSLEDAAASAAASASAAAESLARLLLATLAGLAPAICARHGSAEIAAIIRLLLPSLRTEPRITVKVAGSLAAALGSQLSDLDPDILARVVVLPVEMAPGDVSVGWREGEAVRDTAAIWRSIAAVLTGMGLLDLLPPAATCPDTKCKDATNGE